MITCQFFGLDLKSRLQWETVRCHKFYRPSDLRWCIQTGQQQKQAYPLFRQFLRQVTLIVMYHLGRQKKDGVLFQEPTYRK